MTQIDEPNQDTYREHSVGSHSDDRGGDSDLPCYCDRHINQDTSSIDTATYHNDNGLSDFANADIDIAITDLINWIKTGNTIDRQEQERLKNKIITRVRENSRTTHTTDTTSIDEPNLDEQIDELLRILYVFGSTVTIKDYKTAKQAIKALIATQEREQTMSIEPTNFNSRLDEILDKHDDWSEYCYSADSNKPQKPEEYSTIQAREAIKQLFLEIIGSDEKQDFDSDLWFCDKCRFEPTDDTKHCICYYRNQLRHQLRQTIGGEQGETHEK